MKFSIALASVVVLPFAVACTNGGDDSEVAEQATSSAKVTPGRFKLYGEPHATPNPSCDRHTKLELTAEPESKAHLEEAVDGFCEIAIIPNARDYKLAPGGTSCGSRIFTGTFVKGSEVWSLKITDHRTRLCEDVVPAKIIVEETIDRHQGPIRATKYSHDAPVGGQELTVEGKLASVGGQTTSYAVQAPDGSYELLLDAGEKAQFVDARKARVKGLFKLLSGGDRRAIDVTEMLVCPAPGYVNCMPGPNRPSSALCAPESRPWVSESCDGVQYLD